MNNPFNIKVGDIIHKFFQSGDFIVIDFILVDTKELSLANPVTMKKFQDSGEFWAVSVKSCEDNILKCSHLVPIDMIERENIILRHL